MRASQLVSDFFEWRWTPCVGLTAGSLAFIALALLLIPTRFEGDPGAPTRTSAYDGPRPQRALYAASLAPSRSEPEEARADNTQVVRAPQPARPQRSEPSAPPARGFSPILDRPRAPPRGPEPLPPPPATLAEPTPTTSAEPMPGSVVVVQPEPGGQSREVTVQ